MKLALDIIIALFYAIFITTILFASVKYYLNLVKELGPFRSCLILSVILMILIVIRSLLGYS